MTDPSQVDIQKLSPDKLMRRFSESGIVACIFLAFVLHVIVLGGTSVSYIHGLVDPAWKEQQERLEAEARNRRQAARAAKTGAARPAATAPATRPATRPVTRPKPKGDGERKLPKELTTMPGSGEIPKLPGRGISIDETEGR
jgi:hypothetical protein